MKKILLYISLALSLNTMSAMAVEISVNEYIINSELLKQGQVVRLVKSNHYSGTKVCTYKINRRLVHTNQEAFIGVGTRCPTYIKGS
jgi:hypothetical protein